MQVSVASVAVPCLFKWRKQQYGKSIDNFRRVNQKKEELRNGAPRGFSQRGWLAASAAGVEVAQFFAIIYGHEL